MSGIVSGAKLASVTRDLSEAWQQAQEHWRDSKCQEFERTYMDPLFDAVNASIPAMEELGRTLNKIRRDCE